MTATSVERDERTTAIENAGFRWSYLILSFGLLVIVAFRSFARGQASWDLLALVVLGGVVNAGYQGMHRVLYKRWVVLSAVTLITAALLAAVMAVVRHLWAVTEFWIAVRCRPEPKAKDPHVLLRLRGAGPSLRSLRLRSGQAGRHPVLHSGGAATGGAQAAE
jgi:hypothetical protein